MFELDRSGHATLLGMCITHYRDHKPRYGCLLSMCKAHLHTNKATYYSGLRNYKSLLMVMS